MGAKATRKTRTATWPQFLSSCPCTSTVARRQLDLLDNGVVRPAPELRRSMVRVSTIAEEDAKRPNRERECHRSLQHIAGDRIVADSPLDRGKKGSESVSYGPIP